MKAFFLKKVISPKVPNIWKYSFSKMYFKDSTLEFKGKKYLQEPNYLLSTQEFRRPNAIHIVPLDIIGVWWSSGKKNHKKY